MRCNGFSSIKKAISYCGLCGDQQRSANTVQRTPLSKQRNKHLQTTLIEAAKMAPRYSPTLAMLYDREKQKGNANRATLAVATKTGGLLDGRGSWAMPFLGDRPGNPYGCLRPHVENKVFSARGLPGLAVKPTGRRSVSTCCSR